jgi:hypothetical protein
MPKCRHHLAWCAYPHGYVRPPRMWSHALTCIPLRIQEGYVVTPIVMSPPRSLG